MEWIQEPDAIVEYMCAKSYYFFPTYLVYFDQTFAQLFMSTFVYISIGHLLEDHHGGQGQMAIYGATAGALRSNSSNSSSPGGAGIPHGHGNTSASLLVVTQPINATKIGATLANGAGTGRKYQCKMCPQVRYAYKQYDFYGVKHTEHFEFWA